MSAGSVKLIGKSSLRLLQVLPAKMTALRRPRSARQDIIGLSSSMMMATRSKGNRVVHVHKGLGQRIGSCGKLASVSNVRQGQFAQSMA